MNAFIAILLVLLVVIIARSLYVQWVDAAERHAALRAERLSLARDELRDRNGPPVAKVAPAALYFPEDRAGKLRATEYDWTMQ